MRKRQEFGPSLGIGRVSLLPLPIYLWSSILWEALRKATPTQAVRSLCNGWLSISIDYLEPNDKGARLLSSPAKSWWTYPPPFPVPFGPSSRGFIRLYAFSSCSTSPDAISASCSSAANPAVFVQHIEKNPSRRLNCRSFWSHTLQPLALGHVWSGRTHLMEPAKRGTDGSLLSLHWRAIEAASGF